MSSCNSLTPEEYLVCIETSLHNWVIIKVLYRYLLRCLLSCMDRDWDLSLHVTERYLWASSIGHHHNVHNVTKGLITGCFVTERVKRLAGNEIEQGIGIPTIESRASNVPIDKWNCIRDWLNPRHRGSSDEIIVEHVGANMGIQIPQIGRASCRERV